MTILYRTWLRIAITSHYDSSFPPDAARICRHCRRRADPGHRQTGYPFVHADGRAGGGSLLRAGRKAPAGYYGRQTGRASSIAGRAGGFQNVQAAEGCRARYLALRCIGRLFRIHVRKSGRRAGWRPWSGWRSWSRPWRTSAGLRSRGIWATAPRSFRPGWTGRTWRARPWSPANRSNAFFARSSVDEQRRNRAV